MNRDETVVLVLGILGAAALLAYYYLVMKKATPVPQTTADTNKVSGVQGPAQGPATGTPVYTAPTQSPPRTVVPVSVPGGTINVVIPAGDSVTVAFSSTPTTRTEGGITYYDYGTVTVSYPGGSFTLPIVERTSPLGALFVMEEEQLAMTLIQSAIQQRAMNLLREGLMVGTILPGSQEEYALAALAGTTISAVDTTSVTARRLDLGS